MDDKAHIADWLHSGELGQLIRHLEDIQLVNEAIQSLLSEPFQGGCHVENITQGCVMLAVKDANLMTLLRYEIPNLLAALRKNTRWAGIASIKCHIRAT